MSNDRASQRCARQTKNLWTRCKEFTSKSDKLTRIQLKGREIKERKRAFGIEYFDLEQKRGITSDELQVCIQSAKSAIADLEQEIVALRIGIEQVKEKTRKKIAKRNGKVPQRPRSQPKPTRVNPPVIEGNPFDPSDRDVVVLPAPSAPSEELLVGHKSR